MAPQMILNSEVTAFSPYTDGTMGTQFAGWYPSSTSPGAAAGHTRLTGTLFFLGGCIPATSSAAVPDRHFKSRTFNIVVPTPQSIIDEVNQFQASGSLVMNTNSLLAKLNNALADRDRGNCRPADNVYGAFVNEVTAQSGKGITSIAAATLIADAQYLEAHCP
jgi:hypothetical protein